MKNDFLTPVLCAKNFNENSSRFSIAKVVTFTQFV